MLGNTRARTYTHVRVQGKSSVTQRRSAQVTHRPSSGPWVSPSGTSETPGRRPEAAVSGQSPAALHL